MESVATREVYFGIHDVWIMYVLLVPATAIFFYGIYRGARRWAMGIALGRIDHVPERLKRTAVYVLAQRKVMRERVGGVAHALLSWSMIVLFLGTAVVFVHEHLGISVMRGAFYLYFQSVLLNTAGSIGTIGLIIAGWHRYVTRPRRLRRSREAAGCAHDGIALLWLILIFVQGFVLSGLRIALTRDPFAEYRFAANWIGQLFLASGVTNATMADLHHFVWWLHLVTVLGWIAWLPYSKMMHVFAAPLAVFFSEIGPKGATRQIVGVENADHVGVGALADFSWKDLLDLDACAQCGRCQDVCPAFASDAPLSPKDLILNLGRCLRNGSQLDGAKRKTRSALVGDVIKEEAIWSCTTCRACDQSCPNLVEHVAKIIDLRRFVIDTKGPSPALAKALEGMAVLGNPHNLPASERTVFLEDLDVPIISVSSPPEVVLWLGCSAGYSSPAQEATVALVKLLRAARVNFAITGPVEKCCGDLALRCGEEGLFQELAQFNIAQMRRLRVERLVTNCPHCYTTFKSEYPRLGATWAVEHHTTFIRDLLSAGRIELNRPFDQPMAYHDPCYLGRYSDSYDAPREILGLVSKAGVREMKRSRETSFCCGGGGGQMYLESVPGKTRINRLRFDEAQALDVPILATACPSCKIMLDDAARYQSGSAKMRVKDLAELVCDAAGL